MASYLKDPEEVLDWGRDYTKWLDGDTIVSHEIIVSPEQATGGLVVDSSTNDDTSVTVWLSGGVLGTKVEVTYRITTAGGRTTDRTDRYDIGRK